MNASLVVDGTHTSPSSLSLSLSTRQNSIFRSIINEYTYLRPFFLFCLFVFSSCWPSDIVVSGVYSPSHRVYVYLSSSPTLSKINEQIRSSRYTHETTLSCVSTSRTILTTTTTTQSYLSVCVCFPPPPLLLLKQECTFVSSSALTSMYARARACKKKLVDVRSCIFCIYSRSPLL